MIKVAIIGLGNRGRIYGEYLYNNKDVRIVAICEKNKEFLDKYAHKWGVTDAYTSDTEFFSQGNLADVLVITTQDSDHYVHAISGLNNDYNLLLEKPVSPIYAQTEEIARLAKEKNKKVVVCHVLRYGKFYQKIKQVINSGAIGKVKHINHTENIGYWHFAHSYVRGNWRRAEQSPSILAKCCHDLDLIYWYSGGKCKTVTSNGSLDYFTAKNKPEDAPKYCLDGCKHAKKCPYEARKIYYGITRYSLPYMVVNAKLITQNPKPTLKMLKNALRTSPYGRCVFDCDNNVVERQIVSMLFDNDVTATLAMTAFSKRCYRKIHIYGTMGELYGNDIDGYFILNRFANKCNKIRVAMPSITIHTKCDKYLIEEFVDYIDKDIKSDYLTLIDQTLESHKIAWYAEISRNNSTMEVL